MTEATVSPPATDADAAKEPTDPREEAFAVALAAKLEQGYHVESQGKTEAVIFTKGRRRWFGLVAGPDNRRQRIALGDDGRVTTRGL